MDCQYESIKVTDFSAKNTKFAETIVNRMKRFLARRLYGSDEGSRGGSRTAILIATLGMALGLTVMIVTLAVTRGFKGEIRDKVAGFSQHILVTCWNSGFGADEEPVHATDSLMAALLALPQVTHVQRFVEKPCIVRNDSTFQGFMLKGLGDDYDRSFLNAYMREGVLPQAADTLKNWIVLSSTLATRLELACGDRADVYFMQNQIRMRRLTLSGLFRTDFSEYDSSYGMTALSTLQRLNGWDPEDCSGIEITLADSRATDAGYYAVRAVMDGAEEQYDQQYMVRTMEEVNAGLFAWLGVLDMNVLVILALMLGIAGFTMISGLLIIIFEKTSTIGTLKALGASDSAIRGIFLRLASYIIVRGMVAGNAVGLVLCIVQKYTQVISLDPSNYYLDHVPVQVGIGWLVVLNISMFTLSMLMMLIPSTVISKILPSKTIRFD